MNDCEHNFVTYAGDKFHCHDCGEDFARLPSDQKPEYAVRSTVQAFIEGMITFNEAVVACNLSLDAFKKLMNEMIPTTYEMHEVRTIGSLKPQMIRGAANPRRISDPEVIDLFFTNNIAINKTTPEKVAEACAEYFFDISIIEMEQNFLLEGTTYNITFVDGTKQKVVMKR